MFVLLVFGGYAVSPRPGLRVTREVSVGRQLFESGQLADAQRFFESFSTAYPDDPAGAFYLGRIAFATGQYEWAAGWLERAVRLDEGSADAHLWLGRAYGRRAVHATGGQQFFLARKVKKHLERAVGRGGGCDSGGADGSWDTGCMWAGRGTGFTTVLRTTTVGGALFTTFLGILPPCCGHSMVGCSPACC